MELIGAGSVLGCRGKQQGKCSNAAYPLPPSLPSHCKDFFLQSFSLFIMDTDTGGDRRERGKQGLPLGRNCRAVTENGEECRGGGGKDAGTLMRSYLPPTPRQYSFLTVRRLCHSSCGKCWSGGENTGALMHSQGRGNLKMVME